MIQRHKVFGALAGALLCALATPAFSDQPQVLGQTRMSTELTGYEETPLTLNSGGSGEFTAQIHKDGAAIDYTLTYRDLVDVTQSHIHFGRPATSGGIVLFLCTNLTPPMGVPAPQACPATGGTITGTLTAANIIASTNGQGIDAGAPGFADVLDAIRADAAYVNVHTATHTGGEIRGHLVTRGPFRRGDD